MSKNTITTILVVAVTIGIGVLIAFSGGTPDTTKSSSTGEPKRETAYHKGNPEATVEIVEFSDFQCPACKDASSIIRQVMSLYSEKVVFYYRHFPLGQHQFAEGAAKAAEAAGKQGKFWEMHDAIFENQDDLSNDIFEKLATDLGLDIEKFKTDVGSKEIKDIVAGDKKDAVKLKVNSTPTFFINGEKQERSLSLDEWKAEIDKRLTEQNTSTGE